ncbi:hypothetical protein Vau01_110530 [Virgisporangium aurantiacum]|uniref:AAA domain-containing protein n=1 Tax=Virgisporangium aurantiacum TaxID=175570 RepID=A0A8J4E9A2_9ACTN|nr:hypothetical protein Vau01_110530 [Virgisporangium aurantiacum]
MLIVGESTAGKSRLASETVRRRYGRLRLVEPLVRAGVPAAVQLVVGAGRCVLWLDDVERFLGENGLGRHHLDAIRNAGGERYVVATIRAEEYVRFAVPAGGRQPVSTEAGRDGWDVLKRITRVDLSRRWSPAELIRPAEYGDDPRIVSALPHTDEFGLASSGRIDGHTGMVVVAKRLPGMLDGGVFGCGSCTRLRVESRTS